MTDKFKYAIVKMSQGTEQKTEPDRRKGGNMRREVLNEYGVEVDFDVAVSMMDDEIREEIHMDMAPCTDQEFFDEYAKRHAEKYGEEWELAKENPCY